MIIKPVFRKFDPIMTYVRALTSSNNLIPFKFDMKRTFTLSSSIQGFFKSYQTRSRP